MSQGIVSNMKRTTIWLTEKQQKDLKKQSEKTGISFSEIIRRLIDKTKEVV
jgi:predicted CopG family antitoxin